MAKGRLFFLFIACFLLLSMNFVSADVYVREEYDKSYTRDYETWVYQEDIYGKNRGFTLKHYTSSPTYHYEYKEDYPYLTWTYIKPYRSGSNYNSYSNYYSNNNKYNFNLKPVLDTYSRGREIYGNNYYSPYNRYNRYGGYGYTGNYW